MKNVICCLILFASGVKFYSLRAQETGGYGSGYWFSYDVHAENERNNKNKSLALKQRVVITKESHRTRNITVDYDTAGRVSEYKNQKRELKIRYYRDALKQSQLMFKKGKLVERDSFLWNDKTLREHFHYRKENKLTSHESYKYDSVYVTEHVFEKLKRGRLREKYKQVYEYYPDHTYKKITYFKNGKPSYFSVFDCNPAGQDHKINKDSSYSCIKYDVDSLGNKIKIYITNDNKHSRKTIEYFNEKDQRIAQKTIDLKKDQPVWYIMYKPGSNWVMTKYIWYRHGKENYRMENTYNENDDCTSWISYSKGVMSSRTVNSYNQKGLIEKSESFNKRNKKISEATYQYLYY